MKFLKEFTLGELFSGRVLSAGLFGAPINTFNKTSSYVTRKMDEAQELRLQGLASPMTDWSAPRRSDVCPGYIFGRVSRKTHD